MSIWFALPRPPGRRTAPAVRAVVAGAVVASLALPAAALDGRVDLRTLHQEGASGGEGYSSDNQWQAFGVDQSIRLSTRASLQFQYLARREFLRGTAAGTSVDNRLIALSPSSSLSWQAKGWRFNAFARGNRSDQDFAGTPAMRDDSLEYGLWSSGRFGFFSGDANYQDNTSWRRGEGEDRENRDRIGSGRVRLDLTKHDDVQYNVSIVEQNAVTNNRLTEYTTQHLQYHGDRPLAGSRARATWTVGHRRFEQSDAFTGDITTQYVQPASGGFWLDDTPSFLDPLETQPEYVPALFDNDRLSPTVINIGDNAPVGRDYGGDYRNIQLDFGEPVAMTSAFLYVDRRLGSLPAMFQWDLYFCDEAEGRDWGSAVPAGTWSARYVELESGRQGWEISFTGGVTHRRLKLVDRKLGPTLGDLFITEFEVYRPIGEGQSKRTARQERTTLAGALELSPFSNLQLRVDGAIDRRDQVGSGRLERVNQSALASWRVKGWLLSGQVQSNSEESPSRLRTDSNSRQVTLARRAPGPLSGRVSWLRANDNTYSVRQVTESVTADATWQPAPLLSFIQKVSRGWRTSEYGAGDSDSWVLASEMRSVPRPGLRLDVRRTERWVSQEAGAGFTSFGEAEIDASWEIRPLLSWSCQATSQRREQTDWILRNTLSWSPVRGGSMLFSLQANDYQDSRMDQLRRGGSVSLDWQARARLSLAGSVEKSYERLGGRESWPLGFQMRAYWTF
jgi:hypothetical protein